MELNVTKRQSIKVKSLLKEGKVPGILYGKHIDQPVQLEFDKNQFLKLYRQTGKSTPITLKGEGIDQMVLVHDMQLNPVRDTLIHVDFLGIKKGEKVKADVNIVITGTENVQKKGFEVNVVSDTIEINTIPSKLLNHIDLDISELNDGDKITVADLNLDKDIELVTPNDQTIVVVYTHGASNSEEEEETENDTTEE